MWPCNHSGLMESSATSSSKTPVPARCVWRFQSPLPLSVRSAQHYMRNVIKSSCCVPCCQWEEEQQPVQSFWLSTHKEHTRTDAVWAKQTSLNHQGHVDFLIFYHVLLLHSLNCCYASFYYPSEIWIGRKYKPTSLGTGGWLLPSSHSALLPH